MKGEEEEDEEDDDDDDDDDNARPFRSAPCARVVSEDMEAEEAEEAEEDEEDDGAANVESEARTEGTRTGARAARAE